jgi:pimeloyl-ACP methyl ester carboxylesterase
MAAQCLYLLGQCASGCRRGAGTDILDCADPPRAARSSTADDHDATALLERARAVVQACNVALDGQLGGFSSEAAADDVEAIRLALGVVRLSALGTGDGATALADWARAHPRAVGRLVLDGPSDPGVDEPARSEARAKSSEDTFDAFARRCTSRSTCPLGADPRPRWLRWSHSLRLTVDCGGRTAAHREHGGDGDQVALGERRRGPRYRRPAVGRAGEPVRS